jgi:two-component system, OmpR family, sensor histidine kinase KdpD
MADRLRAPWAAIHVETPASARASEAERDRVAEVMRLAQRLGAEVVTIPGQDVADTVVEYAQTHNYTHIIVVKAPGVRWIELIRGSVTERLIRRAGGVEIHVIVQQPEPPRPPREGAAEKAATGSAGPDIKAYLGSAGFVALALLSGLVLRETLAVSNITLAFLTAVLASAVTYGLWPSLFACLASVLAYNFFFLPPLYTFTVSDPENVVALFFFAVVALIASNLAARVRTQAIAARQRARMTEELYLFSRKLAGAATLDDLLWATVHQIALMLRVRVVILLPEDGNLVVKAGFPPEDLLDEADLAAARWCWESNQAAGRGADTLPGAKRLFMPMGTGRGSVGVIGVDREEPGTLLTPEQDRLLDALSDQVALAIERVNLVEDVDRARLVAETDRLRSALLTSISHDLRTPLASILGSASSLAAHGEELEATVRAGLMRTIQEEAERLNRFIGNLLDMTRLESGPLQPRGELADLSDVVGATLQRAGKILADHRVEVELAPDLPMLALDMVLFEQVLFNLFDNAAKYAPPGSLIQLRARRDEGVVVLEILDEGDGIPEADLERVFDKFYRVHQVDRQRAGTGLGLAICRGFIEAMKGTIIAQRRTDRQGTAFIIRLPVPVGADLQVEAME